MEGCIWSRWRRLVEAVGGGVGGGMYMEEGGLIVKIFATDTTNPKLAIYLYKTKQ